VLLLAKPYLATSDFSITDRPIQDTWPVIISENALLKSGSLSLKRQVRRIMNETSRK
jgi:hypothetical protein